MGKIRGQYAAHMKVAWWKELCEKYENGAVKNKSKFLRFHDVPDNKRQSFVVWLKKYKKGNLDLTPKNAKRIKKGKYPRVERKLLEYVGARSMLIEHDGCGLSFALLSILQLGSRQYTHILIPNEKQINFTCKQNKIFMLIMYYKNII